MTSGSQQMSLSPTRHSTQVRSRTYFWYRTLYLLEFIQQDNYPNILIDRIAHPTLSVYYRPQHRVNEQPVSRI